MLSWRCQILSPAFWTPNVEQRPDLAHVEVGLFRFGSGPTNRPSPAPGPRLALKFFYQIREFLFDPLSPFLLAKLALLRLERDQFPLRI